jgi:uroporphyrinogen decarboxylase
MSNFMPNYQHLIDAAHNRMPTRMPLYDHSVNNGILESILELPVAALLRSSGADLDESMRRYMEFFVKLGYDACPYERGITGVLIGGGALGRHQPGCIKTMDDCKSIHGKRSPNAFSHHMGRISRLCGAPCPQA